MVFRLNETLYRNLCVVFPSGYRLPLLSLFIPRVSSRFSSFLLRKARVCSFQTGGCSRGTEMGVNSDPIVQRQIRWRARVREISGGGRA